jgi:hypothetical protein
LLYFFKSQEMPQVSVSPASFSPSSPGSSIATATFTLCEVNPIDADGFLSELRHAQQHMLKLGVIGREPEEPEYNEKTVSSPAQHKGRIDTRPQVAHHSKGMHNIQANVPVYTLCCNWVECSGIWMVSRGRQWVLPT